MIIIVEGIDRVGKTTLCNKISNKFNVPIYKHVGNFEYSNMDNNNETDKMLQILQVMKLVGSERILVLDRFHLTDYVYGILNRNYDKDKAKVNFKQIEDFLDKNEAILIMLEPTDISMSSKEHGEDLSNHYNIFLDIFKESKIKYKWRCTYNTIDEAITYISSSINKIMEGK